MDDVRQRRHVADEAKEADLADEDKKRLERPCKEETLWDISLEVFLPFIVAGLGMATTGITLNHVRVSAIMSFGS